jgi:hypothetical protein
MAEGSFLLKINGSANSQIRHTGAENLDIIKATCFIITNREAYPIKPDSANSSQLALSSKNDIYKVISFFSSPNYHPLYSYKLSQYIL